MNRKERRAEAKRQHQNINSNTNQEESMNEIITIKTEDQNTNTRQGENTMENSKQHGFFTRIKNAFVAGYRAGKAEIKEQVQDIKDTYVSGLKESKNPIMGHTRATIITTLHILKKAAKSLLSLMALPFIKLDSIIDPQPVTQS